MAAYNINGKCEDCKFADGYGRNCQYGLMYPITVLMTYGDMYKCPNFERKSLHQLKQEKNATKEDGKADINRRASKVPTG